jgi:hypothetical protein
MRVSEQQHCQEGFAVNLACSDETHETAEQHHWGSGSHTEEDLDVLVSLQEE